MKSNSTLLEETFHQRLLENPPNIAFSSDEGKRIFKQAVQGNYFESYFPLSEQFHTQQEPAFCGLASLVIILNALKIDPGRVWKGVWRWFSEELLDCCDPLDEIKKRGTTLRKINCLAKCNGGKTILKLANTVASEEEFREDVKKCTSSGEKFMLISYSRQALKQTGEGHFSPIGGYCEEKDRLLILDPARFKYPPHWVEIKDVWRAIKTIDKDSGEYRGYIILEKNLEAKGNIFTFLCPKRIANLNDFIDLHYQLLELFKNVVHNEVEFIDKVFQIDLKLDETKFFEKIFDFNHLECCAKTNECVTQANECTFCECSNKILNEIRGLQIYELLMKKLMHNNDSQEKFCQTQRISKIQIWTILLLVHGLNDKEKYENSFFLEFGGISKDLKKEIEFFKFQIETLKNYIKNNS